MTNVLICGDGTRVIAAPILAAAQAMQDEGRDAFAVITDALQRSAIVELAHLVSVWVHGCTLADSVQRRQHERTKRQHVLAAQLREAKERRDLAAWRCVSGKARVSPDLRGAYFEQLRRKPRRKVGGKRVTLIG